MRTFPVRPTASLVIPKLVAALLAAVSSPLAAQSPPDIARVAEQAMARGATDSLFRKWSDLAEHGDSVAILGLATLARLRYDYAGAERELDRILPEGAKPGSSLELVALLERARLFATTARDRTADSLFAIAAVIAGQSGDLAPLLQGLVGRVNLQDGLHGSGTALALLDSAAALNVADSWIEAQMACFRSNRLFVTGQDTEAGTVASTGLARARASGNLRAAACCIFMQARMHLREGRIDSGLAVLERSAVLARRAGDDIRIAKILYVEVELRTSFGEYGRAREASRQVLELGLRTGNLELTSFAAFSLAQGALRFGDLRAAGAYARLADSIFAIRPNQFLLPVLRSLQAEWARAAGHPAEAERRYREALQAGERLGIPRYRAYHRALAKLAREQGDRAGFRAHLDSARSVTAKAAMHGWPAELRYNEGLIALLAGRPAEAAGLLTGVLETLDSAAHIKRYPVMIRLAQARLIQNKPRVALRIVQSATDSFDMWRSRLEEADLQLQAYELRDSNLQPDPGLTAVLAGLASRGYVAEAFALSERRRARSLLEAMERVEMFGGAEIRDSTIGREVLSTVDWRSIAESFPDDRTALVEYVTGSGSAPSIAFVITRDTIGAALLPSLIAKARSIMTFRSLVGSGKETRGLADSLGALILGPVIRMLPATVDRLVIVPDHPLQGIPFGALRFEGRSLVEKYAISLAPSAVTYRRIVSRPSRSNGSILAFGDPEIDAESVDYGSGVPLFDSLPRLSGSGREARSVARYGSGSVTLLRSDASEAFFKSAESTKFGIIHFATHAVVDEGSDERSGLYLAPGGGEDGVLHLRELSGRQLPADLVFLSACRTAGGEWIAGEGVQGFTAQFLRAGVRSVVATRWPVEDRRAMQMVERFYAGLAEGMTVGESLQRARLAIREAGAPASEWAAFVLVGDPDLRVSLAAPRRLAGWYLAGGVILAVGLMWWMRSRLPGIHERRTAGASHLP